MNTPPDIHPVRTESSGSGRKPPLRRGTETVRTTALFTSVLFSGLFAGFLTAVLILEASLRSFPAAVYTQVRLVELVHLDDLATVLLPTALLATATVLFFTIARPGHTRWLALVALGLLVTTFIISAQISVPINTDQQSWSVLAPPSDWASVRDRWQIAHLVRTTAAVLAFTTLAAATITRREPSRHTA
ncbi:MAG TPA: anthrone oxygenase family protein [Mycobacterium sp.]